MTITMLMDSQCSLVLAETRAPSKAKPKARKASLIEPIIASYQPAPSPSLHRSIVATKLLVDKTRQDRWQRRPHWPGAGLKLVRRVVLEAAADRTSIRPLLLFLLLLPQLLPTYVCHKAVQPEHCLVSWSQLKRRYRWARFAKVNWKDFCIHLPNVVIFGILYC